MGETLKDQEFLEHIIRNIVTNPDDVKVERIIDERGVLLTLSINPADMGFVIGRKGQTAQAVRTLLKIVGAQSNARVNLKINEPEGSERGPRPSTPSAPSTPVVEEIDTSSVDDLTI